MKYNSEIVIDVPLKELIKKFDSSENMKHWQRGLVSIEHISGEPGMIGSKMKLNYVVGKRKMVIIETVTLRNIPNEFHKTYSTNDVDKIKQNHFEELENGSTKWTSTCELLPLNFRMRTMLWMMPKAFEKQSNQYMTDFKNFVEKEISVTHETA